VGKLITVLIFVSFIIHMVGCVWHWIAELEGFLPGCWVVRYGFMDKDIEEKYQISIYWAFTTLTTVGYGDISAYTYNEKLLAIALMVFGCAVYSFTIGNLQTILNEIDEKQYHLQTKLDTLLAFSQNADLPPDLEKQISMYINNNSFNESPISK